MLLCTVWKKAAHLACHKRAILQCSLRCHVDIWHNEHLSTKNRTCEYIQPIFCSISVGILVFPRLLRSIYSIEFIPIHFLEVPPAKKKPFWEFPKRQATPPRTAAEIGYLRLVVELAGFLL